MPTITTGSTCTAADLVYVDGKLEGKRGRVVDVNYNFRINLADYKRVIGVADTNVSGQFTLAGSHVLTFDRAALPAPEGDELV